MIRLVPIGEGVSIESLDRLAAALAIRFSDSCHVYPDPVDVSFAFDAARRQYHSTAILAHLDGTFRDDRVLGIAAIDLFVPIFTFVFGEAQISGRCALVSIHRLRQEFYGLPADPSLTSERLLKEAVHELGHTFGLRHCRDWTCVMTSSHSIDRLDLKSSDFCPACHLLVHR